MPDRATPRAAASGLMSRRRFVGRSAAMMAGLAGGGTLLTACAGTDSSSSSSSSSGKATFLTILPLENLTFTPELVASADGHFKDQGLEVSFEATQGSAPAIQTVLAGGAFLTRIDAMECMIANATKDTPLRCIGTVIRESSIRFVSTSEDPIEKPEDFVGKTIGIPSEGGSSEWTLDLVLRSAGIDPKRVPRQVVGLTPGTYNLVKSGRIGAYTVGLDTSLLVKELQPEAVVFDPGTVLDAGGQVYVTTQQGLDENRDVLKRYMTAIRAAMDSVLDDTAGTKTIKSIKSKYAVEALKDTSVAKDSLTQYADMWTAGGADDLLATRAEQWQAGYDQLASAGMVKESVDPSSWFTNQVVPKA
ncbi:MAG: ABC transporter substrate-binding protein [Actinomycetes bacterium]